MTDVLAVSNLRKKYDKFELKNVSFRLEKGYIMGFIGRNGAGKTTTLKSILNLVRPDGGRVTFLGKDFFENEIEAKQQIGFMFGGTSYYLKKRLKRIADVYKRFYDSWDESVYEACLKKFDLDENKKIDELSSGMRVKFALALALSHHVRLLILDEPTSGLDPVSRDEILELFQELIEDGERSILFSTQITSDIEKCADFITYIRNGEIVESTEKDEFLNSYKVVKGTGEQLTEDLIGDLAGYKKNAFGFSGLLKTADLNRFPDLEASPADIESIMIYFERGLAQ